MDHDHVHGEHCDHDHDHDDDHHGHGHGRSARKLGVTAVVEDLGPCRKLLKVEVPATAVKGEISKRLDHLRRGVQLKGFRKGKAPKDRIEQLYGKTVREDARDQLLREGYSEAVEGSLGVENVLGEGTIENVAFSAEQGLKFEVTLHTRPTFELGDHKGVEVKVPMIRVEEKDVDAALDRFRRTRGELRPIEGEDAVVGPDDVLSIDLQVWLADEHEVWAEAQAQGQESDKKPLKEEFGVELALPAPGVAGLEVEDLADSLVGLKVGDWGDAETDLPDDFDVIEGRGEPAVLRMQVQAIRRLVLPELTDAWAAEIGRGTVADLRREVREELQQRAEVLRRGDVELRVLATLLERTGLFDLPADLVDKEVENAERRKEFEQRIQGRTAEEAKALVEEEKEEIRRDVERMLRFFFILDVVSKRENIKVSDRDVELRIARMAAQRGERPEKVKEELDKYGVLPQVRHDLMEEKTRAFLREHAKVVESEDL